jgi:hypothetical protein
LRSNCLNVFGKKIGCDGDTPNLAPSRDRAAVVWRGDMDMTGRAVDLRNLRNVCFIALSQSGGHDGLFQTVIEKFKIPEGV